MLLFERKKEEREKIWKQIKEDKDFRYIYLKKDFYAFAIYYFWHNFKTWIKDFHKNIYKFLESKNNWLIIWFRESWKTAIVALIYIIWCITYKKETFILFMAYDLSSAIDKVMNIIIFLKTNELFKFDYWNLFEDSEEKTKQNKDRMPKQKKVSKFISTTWVKVEAVSLKNMKRWKQFLNEDWEIIRPSLLVADDIDIEESVKNIRIIEENETKINSWVLKSLRWRAIFLWNIITSDWVIQRLENTYKNYWYTQRISLIENWEITWKERYVWKQAEADKINNEKYNWDKVVQSIETLSIDKETFNSDFLNIPKVIIWDPVFDFSEVEKCEVLQPLELYKIKIEDRECTLEIYKNWFSKNYFDYLYCWVDVWWWAWWDSDSSVLTFLDEFWELYWKIRSNIINYDHIAQILKILNNEYWFQFFKNSLGIEKNFLWTACLDTIKKIAPELYKKCYIPQNQAKKKTEYTNDIWWITSQSTKEKLKEDLRKAIIFKKPKFTENEKKEFKFWVKSEVNWKIVYEPDWINCKHDDDVISRWIAFQMFLNYNPDYLNYDE